MSRNEELYAIYNYQQNVRNILETMHPYSWQQNAGRPFNQILGACIHEQHPHMQFANNETYYQQQSNTRGIDILNGLEQPLHLLFDGQPRHLQQNFRGYLKDDSVTTSNKNHSSNSSQVKNSRDRVKECIEKGNSLRHCHPKVFKALQDKISLEELKNMDHHFIPEFDLNMGFSYKTLLDKEKLKQNEELGGYIFIASNDTFNEQIESKIFRLPGRYRDSVRCIRPGMPIFLYNYDDEDRKLYGVYKAISFGWFESSIDDSTNKVAKNGKPYTARVKVEEYFKRTIGLSEEDFRYICEHFDGPKFVQELSISKALDLLVLFEERLQINPPEQFNYIKKILN